MMGTVLIMLVQWSTVIRTPQHSPSHTRRTDCDVSLATARPGQCLNTLYGPLLHRHPSRFKYRTEPPPPPLQTFPLRYLRGQPCRGACKCRRSVTQCLHAAADIVQGVPVEMSCTEANRRSSDSGAVAAVHEAGGCYGYARSPAPPRFVGTGPDPHAQCHRYRPVTVSQVLAMFPSCPFPTAQPSWQAGLQCFAKFVGPPSLWHNDAQ